jgi:hypothetical protein
MLLIGAFGGSYGFFADVDHYGQGQPGYQLPAAGAAAESGGVFNGRSPGSLFITLLLQGLVALLALYNGPGFSLRLLELPPLWLALNVLAIVLALHASDFVTDGWSRVYVYGTLALLIISQNSSGLLVNGWPAS